MARVNYWHPSREWLAKTKHKKKRFKRSESGLMDFYREVNLKQHPWKQIYYFSTLKRFHLHENYSHKNTKNFWNERSVIECNLIKIDIEEMDKRKKTNTLTSYKPILKKLISELSPKNILEWGPGKSTVFMQNLVSADCNIIAIEHDKWWHSLWRRKWKKYSNIRIVHKKHAGHKKGHEGYVTYPLGLNKKFDLIMIDGRQRADCARIASLVLSDKGKVIIHDCSTKMREIYHESFTMYETVDFHDDIGTTVLSNPIFILNNRK
jgi:predicted O-methyltransferase YrrM